MSIKKQYLKSKPQVKVTFKAEKGISNNASKMNLVGDFNEWNEDAHEMKALKDGSFSLTLDLDQGREYQFRYLADGATWLNEKEADGNVASGFGDSENSVINL